jgi:futalosine hydrolase
MKYIAILSSVQIESEIIISRLKNVSRSYIAGKTLHKGKIGSLDVLILNTGIGKVNAAHSATAIIEKYNVSELINMGVGGAYPFSGLEPGDIAIAIKEIYGDAGVITPGGWKSIKETGIPMLQAGKKKYFNEFPLDKYLAKKSLNITLNSSPITQVKSGNFVTVSASTGTPKRANELKKRFNAICENMEGAAIAHVCTMYGIPLLEIRGISNVVGMRDKRRWKLPLASENCQNAVLKIISRI